MYVQSYIESLPPAEREQLLSLVDYNAAAIAEEDERKETVEPQLPSKTAAVTSATTESIVFQEFSRSTLLQSKIDKLTYDLWL